MYKKNGPPKNNQRGNPTTTGEASLGYLGRTGIQFGVTKESISTGSTRISRNSGTFSIVVHSTKREKQFSDKTLKFKNTAGTEGNPVGDDK